MTMIGCWLSNTQYQVSDTESGHKEVVTIMGTVDEMKDPILMDELAHFARERVAVGLGRQPEKRAQTPTQKKDIGRTLAQIKKSHDYMREHLHGRYW